MNITIIYDNMLIRYLEKETCKDLIVEKRTCLTCRMSISEVVARIITPEEEIEEADYCVAESPVGMLYIPKEGFRVADTIKLSYVRSLLNGRIYVEGITIV